MAWPGLGDRKRLWYVQETPSGLQWNSRPVTRTGVNPRRGDSRSHDILWWYHVNKYRAMRGNRNQLAPGRPGVSLPADVLWGSFVTHSFLPRGEKWMRDKRTLKDVCGEATPVSYKHSLRGVFVFEITKTIRHNVFGPSCRDNTTDPADTRGRAAV